MFRKPKEKTRLEDTIDHLHDKLAETQPGSEEFNRIVKQLTKLYRLQEKEAPEKINPNTVLLIIGNLAGIGVIVSYEQVHVAGSKAFAFLKQLIK